MGFNLWIKIAALFLIRSKRSTVVLYLMVLSAVAILIFLASLAEGVNDAMIKNSVGIFYGHISGSDLSCALDETKLMTPGVAGVLKRFMARGIVSSEKSRDAVTVISVDPAEEERLTALWKKTIQGRYLKADKREIFLSKPIADRLQVNAGDRVAFSVDPSSSPVFLSISGIYETGIDLLDRGIAFCPFGSVLPDSGTCDFAVFLKEGTDAAETVSRYRSVFKDNSGKFAAWSERMPGLKQLIDLNYVSMNIVILIVFVVVSLGIACAFTIFILKNLREYGIMKAMGVMPSEIAFLIFNEVVLINFAASAAGIICGMAAVYIGNRIGIDLTRYTSHNPYFVVSGMIYPRLTAYSLWVPPVSAFIFSLLSSVWPAVFISRKSTADIIRTR